MEGEQTQMDYTEILEQAGKYEKEMARFLRDLIALPSESCGEEAVIRRIAREMEACGFDRVEIDPMGNVLGWMGRGRHLVALDAHIDTVGVGEIRNWTVDPYEGKEEGDEIWGRGASDQKGGMASMVYAGRVIRDLDLLDDYTLLLTGTVQEEDCDGLPWQYLIEQTGIRPEFVVSTEPTSCRIYRGQRGRMEIRVEVGGISCHGSAPERGDNAIYKMAPIITELRALHENLHRDPFLGRGSLAVTEIFGQTPSRCAVADGCAISVDRRLTDGETWEEALEEIRRLPSVRDSGATVSLYRYERPSWTGLVYPTECYFPTWVLPEEHVATRTLAGAYRNLFREEPVIDKWTFSTNGVAIMGRHGIPTIGFGPGHEDQAHAPDEKTWKSELVKACAMYAAIPAEYVRTVSGTEE